MALSHSSSRPSNTLLCGVYIYSDSEMNVHVILPFSYSSWVAYSEGPSIYLGRSLDLWVGNVESVLSQLFSSSSLYLLWNSTVALKVYSVSVNCGTLICCICHFWGSYSFFSLLTLATSACKYLFIVWSLPWHSLNQWPLIQSHLLSYAHSEQKYIITEI